MADRLGGVNSPGLAVSPSVYTTLEEIDRFADAMEAVLRKGRLTA